MIQPLKINEAPDKKKKRNKDREIKMKRPTLMMIPKRCQPFLIITTIIIGRFI